VRQESANTTTETFRAERGNYRKDDKQEELQEKKT
jgi:hypothetical protein